MDSPSELIADMGSGLNDKKRGLKKLLTMIVFGQVKKIVLTHKDRLLRFGSELIFHLCKLFSVEVQLIDAAENQTEEENLAQDVIELMVVFCARLYGKRAHKKKLNH